MLISKSKKQTIKLKLSCENGAKKQKGELYIISNVERQDSIIILLSTEDEYPKIVITRTIFEKGNFR